ncbi:hypothetical protein BDW59DRAFT_170490 [Aspergillus cavernicola]|uniref:Nucleoside phosphorylase domain-containing protein n=1 Tax=Aspergillus cavernicola TaxID=176166 RepID=A0ABR4INZ6_9EURO
MLDASHTPLPRPKGDNNTYHLGEIGDHNIVIACLPTGIYGLTSAAVVANQMLITFPSIEFGLMVGIGGGAPSKSADIRLGDIVVSKPTDGFPGVIQYDYGKTLAGGVFHRTGTLNNPPQMLLTAISDLQAKHRLGDNRIPTHLATAAKGHPSMSQSFIYPRATKDILFEPSYNHRNNHASCTSCSLSETVSRPPRTSTVPRIHYGLIASANQVMKDAQTRDRVGKELGILCYEMEAAGLMNHFPSLVIRGICDYSDSHKDKIWQDYAAATAAAYARELLQSSLRGRCTIPPTSMRGTIRSKIPLSKSVFFGREMELKQVRQVLNLTIRARQTAVIWGLSGYGKTQLALEYITAQRAQYDSILWIDSSSRGMIEQSFENISSQLPPNTRNEGPAVERVLGWLEQGTNSSWIMVLDGVESLDDNDSIDDLDIRTFFPSCDHGHILLVTTSRDLHLRLGFPDIAVQNVDDQTGAEILMACAGGKPGDSSPKSKAMVISRKLGGMPLAIQQAGSFLSYGMISMSDYTQQFQMRYLDKTLKTPLRKYVGSYEKGRTLWTTFDILYRALAQRSWDSVRLLSLAAFLGRGQIPFSTIFREGVNQGETWERLCAVSTQGEPKGPMVELAELLQWLMELRSDIDRVALAVRELEGSGFISFHRSAGDTAIDSFAIHDLARSFIQSKAPQERAFDILATSFLISGLQLYDGCNMPSEALVRKHMGRLIGVLDLFLAGIPGHTLEPPDGQYFALCAAVSPMYARICRYQGKLDTAAHLWKIALQYRFILDTGQPKRDVDLQDHMEAADIDARLGHFEDAIDKYSLVVTWSKDCHSQDDELAIRAAGYLRQVRERYEQHKQDLDRAVIAHSAPKAVLQDLSDDLDIGSSKSVRSGPFGDTRAR